VTLNLYNTLTRRLEPFTPLDPAGRRVTFYSCGPTVYDYAHIGNFRSFLNADLLRRTLELLGYEVVHVMNMTDVGHMTDDVAGEGEDRMEKASRRLQEAKKSGTLPDDAGDVDPRDPYAIAEFYAKAFLADARRLGLLVAAEYRDRPELMPRPTRCIPEMIELVETLIDKGHAYVADDGAVYFDVQTFGEYGRLSGNTPDAVREAAGGRVDEAHQAHKRHPADFLLWKPDPAHLMRWPSPWGEGYPGWHLECSVMAQGLLGRDTNGVIDIHSGGEDNIFPHHECEIAQTRCAFGVQEQEELLHAERPDRPGRVTRGNPAGAHQDALPGQRELHLPGPQGRAAADRSVDPAGAGAGSRFRVDRGRDAAGRGHRRVQGGAVR
jgi:cysteinyl-tRNA synthetase